MVVHGQRDLAVATMSLERLFDVTELNVVVPNTRVEYPPHGPVDDWLAQLKEPSVERKQAFYGEPTTKLCSRANMDIDEQLQFILTLSIPHLVDETPDLASPPPDLLSFLAHLQVSLEASYISPVPLPTPDLPHSARLSAPPRKASLLKAQSLNAHPSIYPPNTPNPTPSTAEPDRRYIRSEGTLLLASIWGQDKSPNSVEAFTMLWSEATTSWVAVYRLVVSVCMCLKYLMI